MMDAQIIDVSMARALHQDALRDDALVGWAVWHDHPARMGRFVAQLLTSGPQPYMVAGDTLAEVQEQLPPGLERFGRQPVDPLEVVEIWLTS